MNRLEREARERKPESTDSYNQPTVHNGGRCRGFGAVIARPEITQLLGVTLRDAGFAVGQREVIGISDKLKFGSRTCRECSTWLRKS